MRRDGRDYRQQHEFLSIYRPASGRLLRHPPPFSSCCRSMGLGRGAVNHVDIPVGRLHQGVKQSPPYSACRPAMEPVLDCRWRSVAGRAIPPPATRPQHMNNATDDPAVIDAMSARLVDWKQRRNVGPLPIIKPEFTCHDQNSSCGAIESQLSIQINVLSGF